MLTPSNISLVASLILTVLNIVVMSLVLKDRANAPEAEQNSRLDKLEEDVRNMKNEYSEEINSIRRDQTKSDERIANLEQSSRVQLKCMGALIAHSINSNNVDDLEKAKNELDNFLYSR